MILFDDTHAVMDRATFEALPVFTELALYAQQHAPRVGDVWRKRYTDSKNDLWYLGTLTFTRIHWRKILVAE